MKTKNRLEPTRRTQLFRSTRHRSRRGISLVLVLFLMAMAVAVSYSMILTQNTMMAIDQNLDIRVDTRAAAYTGLSDATRNMHLATWHGVDSQYTKQIDDTTSFTVSYVIGDSYLESGDIDWELYPYRVTATIRSTYTHPHNTELQSSHTLQAVFQLIPGSRETENSEWTSLIPKTLAQLKKSNVKFNPPTRVVGDSLFQGSLELFKNNQPDTDVRIQLFGDYKSMYDNLGQDIRPIVGNVTLKTNETSAESIAEMRDQLGINVTEESGAVSMPYAATEEISTYQLFAGGATYTVPRIQSIYGNTLSNVNLDADPLTNPLGIFYSSGSLTFGENVTLNGTISSSTSGSSDINLAGTNIVFSSPALLPIEGETSEVHLPTLLVGDDLIHQRGATATIKGMLIVWDKFKFKKQNSTGQLDILGKLWCEKFESEGSDKWDGTVNSERLWPFYLGFFGIQSTYDYFPHWLDAWHGISSESILTLQPNSTPWTYHWNDWSTPLYSPAASDEGLRWKLVRLTETT